MPNNLLQDNTNNTTTNSVTLMKQTGGGVPSNNETPPSAAFYTNVGATLENKDLNFENMCPPDATAVPTTGEENKKEQLA